MSWLDPEDRKYLFEQSRQAAEAREQEKRARERRLLWTKCVLGVIVLCVIVYYLMLSSYYRH